LGTLDGVRVLKPETVAQMMTNQVGHLHPKIGPLLVGKYGFGFGLLSTTDGGKPVADLFYWGGASSRRNSGSRPLKTWSP
jgi:hypothetical protein